MIRSKVLRALEAFGLTLAAAGMVLVAQAETLAALPLPAALAAVVSAVLPWN